MNSFTLSKTWQVLGPFPIGTREQDFGADPLENYGGFSQLKYSTGAKFPSELAEGGFVGWSMVNANNNTLGPIDFRNIRWKETAVPFGWSIEQYQAWARGVLIINEPAQLFLQISGVSEFYINNKRYHGDCYSYNTTHHIIQFEKGKHNIDVRMVHDVRMFGGGKEPPQCQFTVHLDVKNEALLYPEDCAIITPTFTNIQKQTQQELLMPDYLTDIGFAGSYGSVSIQNAGDDIIRVKSVTLCVVDDHSLESRAKNGLFVEYKTDLLVPEKQLFITPGQIRPIGFKFQKDWTSLPAAEILRFWVRIGLQVGEQSAFEEPKEFAIRATANVRCVDWIKNAFKYTFLDYDNTVQYAMARRPSILSPDAGKPVIVALHGAGVEADSKFWIDSIPQQKSTWVVYPTGRTPWGYDWHGPSTWNVFKALDGLKEIQELLPPHFECFDSAVGGDWVNVAAPNESQKTLKPEDHREWVVGNIEKLIFMGHSNGGQGVWHFATHFTDKIIAVIPAAGYIKIQDYVSFSNWVGQSYCDPLLKGILESSIAEYNNDLHLSNMVNMNVLPRIGTEDDNVPPLHTRRYVRILNGLMKNPTGIKTSEALGHGHWWNTVFDNKTVLDFLRKQETIEDQPNTNEFCLTVINPATHGSMFGIYVEQLGTPFKLGKIKGALTTDNNKTILNLKTTNIASFKFTKFFKGCKKLIIDGDRFSNLEKYHTSKGTVSFTFDKKSKKWRLDQQQGTANNSLERMASRYGPIHRMYESQSHLVIVIPHKSIYEHAALQISHDWYLYGRGDSVILYDDEDQEDVIQHSSRTIYYRIYLGVIGENKRIDQILNERPSSSSIELSSSCIKVGERQYREPGTGILLMHPNTFENEVAVIISGIDLNGFDTAFRLLPKRTGIMVPEWIVTSGEMKANGLGGVLAAGYFENDWKPFGYL